MYIPRGFVTVTPYFFVKDAERIIEFLVKGLGGTETVRSLRPDGRIANVQIRIGSATVMASEVGGSYPPMPAACYLFVEDADAAMAKALAARAALELAVTDMPP